MKQILLDDFSTVIVTPSCECRLKFKRGSPPQIGSYVDGTCEQTDWSRTSDDCVHKGECCTAPYEGPTYGT
jgi:hypothetical protein